MHPKQILVLLLVSLHFTDCWHIVTVREGEDAVLSCGAALSSRCESDWVFLEDSRSTALFVRGQRAPDTPPGAELMDNCSTVLKNVRREQAGFYSCSTPEHKQEAYSVLAVVTVSEHGEGPVLTLNCSVRTVRFHKPTLRWLIHGEEVSRDHPQLRLSHSDSSVSVSFDNATAELRRSLSCEASDIDGRQAEEKPTIRTWSTEELLLRHVVVGAALAVLLVCVGALNIWTGTRECKTMKNPQRPSRRSRRDVENSDVYKEIGDTSI